MGHQRHACDRLVYWPPRVASSVPAKMDEIQQMKVTYANPLYNVLCTFIEAFPVGLVITLISAAVLRKKARPESAQTAAIA